MGAALFTTHNAGELTMHHRSITCRNHPDLRWSCKDIAWTETPDGGHYNGSRNIFFKGRTLGTMYADNSGVECSTLWPDNSIVRECDCPSSDLTLAPDDANIATN